MLLFLRRALNRLDEQVILTRFLFFADAHVDGNAGWGRRTNGIPQRVLDVVKNFDYLVDFAIDQDVDFVLFGGDMYQHHNPSKYVQDIVQKRIMRLSRAGITTIMVFGNHDVTKNTIKGHALSEFKNLAPENAYVIEQPETLYFDDVTITGIPWLFEPLDYTPNLPLDTLNLAIAHCSVPEVVSDWVDTIESLLGKEFIIPLDYFEQFDFVGLGHIHSFRRWGHVMYPGSMEMFTWGEAEKKHGFIYYNNGDISFHPYYTRPRYDLEFWVGNIDLPEIDPEGIYRITLKANSPDADFPDLSQHFRDVFNVKFRHHKPKRERDRTVTLDPSIVNPTEQLNVYFESIGEKFDEELKKEWTSLELTIN